MSEIIQMQGYMADDLSAVFRYDMPITATIGTQGYTVLMDDKMRVELDAFGGPEDIDLQHVHFKTTDLVSIVNGSRLQVASQSKIVVSSVTSADGNELIVTVRGD